MLITSNALPAPLRTITALGQPVKLYASRSLTGWMNVGWVIIGLALTAAIAYYEAIFYPRAYPAVASKNAPFLLGVAGLLLLLTLYGGWRVLIRWNEAAAVFEEGFAYFDGRRVHVFRWDEVAALFIKVVKMSYYGVIPAGTQQTFTVIDGSGKPFRFGSNLKNVQDLLNRIQDQTFPYLAVRAQHAYEAGQSVQFGPISVSRLHGITAGKKTFAWNNVESILIQNGQVRIKPRAGALFGGASVQVSSVPNLHVFLPMTAAIAEEYLMAS